MEIEWTLVWPLLGVLVLTILITGPGLWSDAWGHGWLDRARRPREGKAADASGARPR